MPESDTISGLRGQIKANAVLLFPSVVEAHEAKHQASNSYLYIPSTAAFEIVVLKVTLAARRSPSKQAPKQGYQAYLSYSSPVGPKRAAQGESAENVVGALQSLLDTTGRALASKTLSVFKGEGFGNWKEYGGGFVDEEAAVQ